VQHVAGIEVLERAAMIAAGVVHEYVQCAEVLLDLGEHRTRASDVAGVPGDRQHALRRPELPDGATQAFRVTTGDRHTRAELQESPCRGQPDARAAARDQNRLARDFHELRRLREMPGIVP
jgi:hypothetical protein